MAEIGRKPINSLDVIDINRAPPEHLKEDGRYKWPKAIPILNAWRFVDPPSIVDFLGHQLPQNARTQAVQLDEADAAKILKLKAEEVRLPDYKERSRQLTETKALSAGRQSRGPVPTDWAGTVSRSFNGPAKTYALRFGKRDIWKIGFAGDCAKRLSEINAHIPVEVTNENWSLEYQQSWPVAKDAFDMEQHVLRLLDDKRTAGERVNCTEAELLLAWQTAIGSS